MLFGVKISGHFSKSEQDKLPLIKYFWFAFSLFISLPFLGALVVCVYIMNGDKIGAILAFQIGLTSPAIVQGLIISAANNMANKESPALQDQQ